MSYTYPIEIDSRIGIIPGNDNCVFIKTGKGGGIYGYEEKYIEISMRINENFGYTVCVSANPVGKECVLSDEIAELNRLILGIKEILYVGFSNGAMVGAQQAYQIETITRMLLINGPLMFNWHKTKSGVEKFKGNEVVFVYGENDPSFKYFDLLGLIKSGVVKKYLAAGADHNFSNMAEEFKDLVLFFVQGIFEIGGQ